jgi:hypothetical protein
MAAYTGLTYKQVNVILFVFLHPAITLYFILRIWLLKRKMKYRSK